ncbi:MAG: TonB-dependent receptor, partial [Gammaproteobacteria bacterium]|nr:TonB-dependent receptor [Gammaproteobacteria bacterium]MBT4329877.1 TonB-dependent receptor [Gammaproteobacteria bacterium]
MSRANLHTQQTLSSLLLFILLPLASAAAVTVEERLSLDELDAVPVVLTPSRIVQPIDESPAAVTIIGRKKIEASGIRSIAELFRLVPGMFVVYSNGLLPQVKYHGLDTAGNSNSRHLQVLIDGRSIYQSGFSRVLWTDIPLLIEDIERIEVVRSPSTVSHGTNAFMGVINIITRNPADTTQLLTLSTGSQQQREMGFRHSDTYGQLNYRLSMKYAEDAGFDTSQKRDGQDLHLLNIRGEYSASPSDQLDLDLGYKSGDKEDSTLTGPTEGRWSNHYQNIGWTHDLNLNDQLQLTAYHQQRQVKQEWGNNKDINWDEERYHLDLQYNKTHSEQLRSVSGGSIRHDRVKA